MHDVAIPSTDVQAGPLEFAWIELTNQCNLECVHCYASSGPNSTERDLLSGTDYHAILDQLHALGCKRVQFIGGEPTLNKDLVSLLDHAHRTGFTFIEVFTNLVHLSDELLTTMRRCGVSVATSFYSDSDAVHDAITTRKGSHARTVRNISRVLAADLPLRVGLIDMPQNREGLAETTLFLRSLGVQDIGMDQLRGFGRGASTKKAGLDELCGGCAGNILVIGPDGIVAPCIMSKQWSVGSVRDRSLAELAGSNALSELRARIAQAHRDGGHCEPQCAPVNTECVPNCNPNSGCLPCAPNGGHKCQPNEWCNPGQ